MNANLNDNPKTAQVVFQTMLQWLLSYVQSLGCADADCLGHFDLKRVHTLRVVGEITTLGRHLQLSVPMMSVARTVALLHDVGRFEQYKRFRTYSDHASIDHAALGVRIVKNAAVLGAFDSQTQAVIHDAIFFHNKPALPVDRNEETLFFARLIRDADKLDIYRVVLKYGSYAERIDGSSPKPLQKDVSDQIHAALLNGRAVDYVDIKNETDIVLARIGWVYDINFLPALRQIAKRKYIERLAACLPVTPKVAQILAGVRQYLQYRCALDFDDSPK